MRGGPSRPLRLFALGYLGVGAALSFGCQLLFDGEIQEVRCLQEGVVGPPACPAGLGCQGGLCAAIVPGTRQLGAICAGPGECADGLFCLDPADFGGEGVRVCSRPCCSSSECEDTTKGFVCWEPDLGGGSFCRSTAAIGRDSPGEGVVGEACFVDSYCRSGLCKNGACVDGCCADNDCVPLGGTCTLRVKVISSGTSWTCAAPVAKAAFLEPCAVDSDCTSNLCIDISGEMLCSRPCCKSDECPDHVVAGLPGFLACSDVVHKGSFVRTCSRWVPESATAAVGAECTSDTQCRSGTCTPGPSGSFCTDVCCVDPSCGDLSRFVCRPGSLGENYALRCGLK